MIQNETQLRDYLAENLELIEAGMELREVEYRLPNQNGAAGRVDILARDRFDNFVIIELKFLRPVSRSAIHEIFKYSDLVARKTGVPDENLRCIIVSTDWHELLTPFSLIYQKTDLNLEGVRLILDENNYPIRAEAIKPLDSFPDVFICPIYFGCVYRDKDTRDNIGRSISEHLNSITFLDAVIYSVEYAGEDERVIYPYGLCVILNRIPEEFRDKLPSTEEFPIEYETAELPAWDVEEFLINALIYKGVPGPVTAELIPMRAARAMDMMGKGWRFIPEARIGQAFRDTDYFDDKKLLELCLGVGVEAPNEVYYSGMSSPKFRKQWKSLPERMDLPLAGNRAWSAGVDVILDEIKNQYPNAAVLFYIFNPLNILMALYGASTGNFEYTPRLRITTDQQVVYSGFLFEQQNEFSQNPLEAIFQPIFGDFMGFSSFYTMGELYNFENTLMNALGLEYKLKKTTTLADGKKKVEFLNQVNNHFLWQEPEEAEALYFEDWMRYNEEFLQRLKILFDENMFMAGV